MKVIVCGGRDFDDVALLRDSMESLLLPKKSLVIIGGCRGADKLAAEWARDRGYHEVVVPANWERYGNFAGPVRNAAMLKLEPDLVVAFPGGKGTANMVKQARAAGVKTLGPMTMGEANDIMKYRV